MLEAAESELDGLAELDALLLLALSSSDVEEALDEDEESESESLSDESVELGLGDSVLEVIPAEPDPDVVMVLAEAMPAVAPSTTEASVDTPSPPMTDVVELPTLTRKEELAPRAMVLMPFGRAAGIVATSG